MTINTGIAYSSAATFLRSEKSTTIPNFFLSSFNSTSLAAFKELRALHFCSRTFLLSVKDEFSFVWVGTWPENLVLLGKGEGQDLEGRKAFFAFPVQTHCQHLGISFPKNNIPFSTRFLDSKAPCSSSSNASWALKTDMRKDIQEIMITEQCECT